MRDRLVLLVIVLVGGTLLVAWTLTRLQGACLRYWQVVGGETAPCWLPFGS